LQRRAKAPRLFPALYLCETNYMTPRISNLGTALLFLSWALYPAIAAAQAPGRAAPRLEPIPAAQSAGKSADTPGNRAASSDPADDDQEYVFSTEIQIVTVPVTVTNAKKQFVTDLDKREFTVLDNGQAQRIENFELTEEPLSLAIIAETSARVQTLLPELRRAGGLITQLILGETGEAAVITFDREVKIAQDFTQDSDKIEKAMKDLKAGADQTHLSDAVARAMFLLQQRPRERRKVIIILSEARDQGSKNKFGLVLRSAQQLGISVYTVGLSTLKALFGTPAGENAPSSPYPPGVVTGPSARGVPAAADAQTNWGAANVNLLEIISDLVTYAKSAVVGNPLTVFAAGTGGAEYPTDNQQKLEQALSRIGDELRNQYLLTYRPNNMETFGFHTIQVSVSRRDLETRFRPGYVLAPQIQKNPSSPAPASNPPAKQNGDAPTP
jgi:VWFA-related protein